jgi:hypothetical protein
MKDLWVCANLEQAWTQTYCERFQTLLFVYFKEQIVMWSWSKVLHRSVLNVLEGKTTEINTLPYNESLQYFGDVCMEQPLPLVKRSRFIVDIRYPPITAYHIPWLQLKVRCWISDHRQQTMASPLTLKCDMGLKYWGCPISNVGFHIHHRLLWYL